MPATGTTLTLTDPQGSTVLVLVGRGLEPPQGSPDHP